MAKLSVARRAVISELLLLANDTPWPQRLIVLQRIRNIATGPAYPLISLDDAEISRIFDKIKSDMDRPLYG